MKYIAVFLLLGLLSGCYQRDAETTGFEGKTMPSFNLLLADSNTRINTQTIPTGKPVVLCYVGTHCPYSRAEIQDIIDNIQDLSNVRLYIFTDEPFRTMRNFYNHYQLKKYPNIIMGVDSISYFGKYFQAKGVPYTAIYTKDKKLRKAYSGKIEAAIIKDIVSE